MIDHDNIVQKLMPFDCSLSHYHIVYLSSLTTSTLLSPLALPHDLPQPFQSVFSLIRSTGSLKLPTTGDATTPTTTPASLPAKAPPPQMQAKSTTKKSTSKNNSKTSQPKPPAKPMATSQPPQAQPLTLPSRADPVSWTNNVYYDIWFPLTSWGDLHWLSSISAFQSFSQSSAMWMSLQYSSHTSHYMP